MRAPRNGPPSVPAGPNGQLPTNRVPQAPTAAEPPSPERDLRGRFAPGNRGGPGNPFARRVADLRRALLDTVTPDDLQAITRQLIAKAREGDVAAARLVLAYTLGKPAAAVDPDRVETPEPPPAPWKPPVYRPATRGSRARRGSVEEEVRKDFWEVIDNVLLPGLVRGLPPEALPSGIKLPPAALAALGPSVRSAGGTGGQAPSPNGGNGAATPTAPSPNGGNGAAAENRERG